MQLGDMDKEILQHKAEGKTDKEVATLIFRCQKTVEYRVKKIVRYLQCKNITEAVAVAIRNNLI